MGALKKILRKIYEKILRKIVRELWPFSSKTATLTLLREQLLTSPRHLDKRRLTYHGYKAYSQNDEDGIIAEIFRRIGVGNKTFIEFGVERGRECNTLWLLYQGWSGLWIQGDKPSCDAILQTHASYINEGNLKVTNDFVTRENIEEILKINNVKEIDFLCIDVDGNDYWIWESIESIRPRLVCVEYNSTWPPPVSIVVPYSAFSTWNLSNYFGCSLAALTKLGARKGYKLVGCCLAGVNAFFVREDLIAGHFIEPGNVSEHYEPPRYYLGELASGHPAGIGPVTQV